MINKTILAIVFLLIGALVVFLLPRKSQNTMILPIPFSSQAPTGNWEDNKDCEETSIAMVKAFFEDKTEISVSEVVATIKQINDWERENLGYNRDTGAEDTERMAKEIYGFETKLVTDFTADDLKSEIVAGNPILLPVNAGLLGNPKYESVTPFYHMFVIKGYQGDKFIINDPGTESGKDNEYTFETLRNATANWNQQSGSMEPNKKVALVLSK